LTGDFFAILNHESRCKELRREVMGRSKKLRRSRRRERKANLLKEAM
jgi:hypothetical protein